VILLREFAVAVACSEPPKHHIPFHAGRAGHGDPDRTGIGGVDLAIKLGLAVRLAEETMGILRQHMLDMPDGPECGHNIILAFNGVEHTEQAARFVERQFAGMQEGVSTAPDGVMTLLLNKGEEAILIPVGRNTSLRIAPVVSVGTRNFLDSKALTREIAIAGGDPRPRLGTACERSGGLRIPAGQ
jgi:hypothetical protein